mmetsp:Transcript_4530/g.28771  ORF Transcript_4530/g.28771 Transcript_4530/m.28771 type:complete len:178 (-) Transcript_4530:3142-3675(-)
MHPWDVAFLRMTCGGLASSHPTPHHGVGSEDTMVLVSMASMRVARTFWSTKQFHSRPRKVKTMAMRRGKDVEAALEAYTAEKRSLVAVVTLRRPRLDADEEDEDEEEEVALVFRGMTSSLTHPTNADLESSVLGDAQVVDVSLAEAPYQPNDTNYVRKNVQVEELLEEIGMDSREWE